MGKAEKKYRRISNLYYIASFLQTIIIAILLFIIFSKIYVYIKDIVYNKTAIMVGMTFLPYLPVITVTLLILLFCVMLISWISLVTPIVLNDLCKERRLLFSKISVFYSFGIYSLIKFCEKTVTGYMFVFMLKKIDVEFILFLIIHLFFLVILCVLSHRSKNINKNIAETVWFNVR